jgi:hypothetical protein
VVERSAAALNTIAQEMDRHLDGSVSQQTELSIGKQLGAQVIVSGTFARSGQNWRLDIKTLNVESAQIAAQWSAENIRTDPSWASFASPRSVGLSFEGDTLAAQRDKQTVIAGLRNAMQESNFSLELDENAPAGGAYGFTVTVYLSRPPANPSLIQAEVTVSFSQGGRALFQSAPYYITEMSETLLARRIAERLRGDKAFFGKVFEEVRRSY